LDIWLTRCFYTQLLHEQNHKDILGANSFVYTDWAFVCTVAAAERPQAEPVQYLHTQV
jgi:hypothetical protein